MEEAKIYALIQIPPENPSGLEAGARGLMSAYIQQVMVTKAAKTLNRPKKRDINHTF